MVANEFNLICIVLQEVKQIDYFLYFGYNSLMRERGHRLPVEQYARAKEVHAPVEPAFTIGEVAYYDALPSEPKENPRQTLLPMSLIGQWVNDYITTNPEEKRRINWNADESGIENPRFGSVKHYATVEYDTEGNLTKYLFDGILQEDGTLDPRTGIATPGSVVAPIEDVDGKLYVHCFYQWRPAAWDQEMSFPAELTDPKEIEEYKASQRGMWMLTVPGGFAEFVGDSPEAVGRREAMEEAGLAIDKPVFARQSFNRASTASLINVGFSTFKRVGNELQSEGELLMGSGKTAVRIDAFRSQDAMSSAAVNTAREGLGLIRYGR